MEKNTEHEMETGVQGLGTIGIILGLYWGSMGRMEKKTETTTHGNEPGHNWHAHCKCEKSRLQSSATNITPIQSIYNPHHNPYLIPIYS